MQDNLLSAEAWQQAVIQPVPDGVQTIWPFYKPTKYLKIEPFDVHVLGTPTVSDWMMRSSCTVIQNILGALRHDEHRVQFAGTEAFLVTDVDPDLTAVGSIPGHRNTGGTRKSMFNEVLVCATAVDTIRPDHAPEYRAWDTPIHEFGHTVEITLGHQEKSDKVFSENLPNYNPKVAREYFAWGTEKWFNANMRPGRDRESMPEWEYDYFASVFSAENTWTPNADKQYLDRNPSN